MSQDLDALITEHQKTPEGMFTLNRVIHDFAGIVPLLEKDDTRAEGEKLLKFWADEGSDLRKGIAGAWMARATHAVGSAIKTAHPTIGKLKGIYGSVEGSATNIGHKVGKETGIRTAKPVVKHAVANGATDGGLSAGVDHAHHFARMGANAGKWGFRAGLAAAGGGAAYGISKGILGPDNLMKSLGKGIIGAPTKTKTETQDSGKDRKFGSAPRKTEQTIAMPGTYVKSNGSPTLLGAPKKKKVGSQDVGAKRQFGSAPRKTEQTVNMPGSYVGSNNSPKLPDAPNKTGTERQDSKPHNKFGTWSKPPQNKGVDNPRFGTIAKSALLGN